MKDPTSQTPQTDLPSPKDRAGSFNYDGAVYVRPVGRGIVLLDLPQEPQLDEVVPEMGGHYHMRVHVTWETETAPEAAPKESPATSEVSPWVPRTPESILAQNERLKEALASRGDQRIGQFIENALRGTKYACASSAHPDARCLWNLQDEEILALLEATALRAETT